MSSTSLLEMKHVKKTFGSLEVLKDISIEVNEGELHILKMLIYQNLMVRLLQQPHLPECPYLSLLGHGTFRNRGSDL